MAILVGTGNPAVDIPAVQSAVNLPGNLILRGHFSFDGGPGATITTALAPVGYPNATIKVSKPITISGENDATIEGGAIPFYVEAPGASVTIQGLRFIRPTAKAIVVYAANGLIIANCKIEGVVPVSPLGSSAIDIDTTGTIPTLTNPGHPENIFGMVLVTDNEIDVAGGTSADNTLGIVVFSVGQSPGNEADIYISGNKIRNTTQPAINLRRIGGQAVVDGNEIDTGSVSGQASEPEVIRAGNTGSYVIAHNTIQCEWPDAIGIGVFSQIEDWRMEHAVVAHNSVTMSSPPGVTFGALSAGIDIRGFANDNVVAHNRIRGCARAALAVDPFKGGIPADNAFIHNDLSGFAASIADIVIGQGVTDTLLLGQAGTVEDLGVNTIIV
jgi:hypothetical protein